MNCWEALYMHMHYKQDILIPEQQVTDTNPFFDLATIPCDFQATSTDNSSQPVKPYTHTHHLLTPDQLRHLLFYHQVSIFLSPCRTI